MGINVAGEMLAKLSVQFLRVSRVAERRGKRLVFPFFRFCRNYVYFKLVVNSRYRNQKRPLLKQWHQFEKQDGFLLLNSVKLLLGDPEIRAKEAPGRALDRKDGKSRIDECPVPIYGSANLAESSTDSVSSRKPPFCLLACFF